VIELGYLRTEAADIAHWEMYNGATFVWLKGEAYPPYKIQGDFGDVLRAAGLRSGQVTRQKASAEEQVRATARAAVRAKAAAKKNKQLAEIGTAHAENSNAQLTDTQEGRRE